MVHSLTDRAEGFRRRPLEVAVEPEGLLVSGDPDEVESYTSRLVATAKQFGDSVGEAASSLEVPERLAVVPKAAGSFTRIAPKAREALDTIGLTPGSGGLFQVNVRGAEVLKSAHLHWDKVSLTPRKALHVQLAVATMSLKSAVRNVDSALRRVQGTADQVLALADASRAGDVLGHHRMLERLTKLVAQTDALPTADWESVASMGPWLEVVVERLRAYAQRTLEALSVDASVQDKARQLGRAVADDRLGETLQMLLVAEDSIYLWQQLRIERVRAEEAEHLPAVLVSARGQLREHAERDKDLLLAGRAHLAEYGSIKTTELHRRVAAARLKRDVAQLYRDLDEFSHARQSQVAGWLDQEDQRLTAALAHIGRKAWDVGGVARLRLGRVTAVLPGQRRRPAEGDEGMGESGRGA